MRNHDLDVKGKDVGGSAAANGAAAVARKRKKRRSWRGSPTRPGSRQADLRRLVQSLGSVAQSRR